MSVSSVLDLLNEPQRAAVTAPPGNIMVLAGAGSGKTRVLTHRIAWHIQNGHASPYAILAVTFTNKAAAEMRARIGALLDMSVGGMWIGTFHGLAHRILRAHWREANLPQDFAIIDAGDQQRALARVLKSLSIGETQLTPRDAQWFVNHHKENGRRSSHIDDQNDHRLHQMIRVYAAYEDECQRSGVVDFAELLLRVHELLRDQTAILQHYQDRFRFVLVDEFQDTNTLQYAWLRLLAGEMGTIFAVGDDDQSIYSWRGACSDNMQRFKQDFVEPTLIKLEQNYRSTANILNAANALITHNSTRLGKNLWTAGDKGDKIAVYNAYNDQDEAQYVVDQIAHWYREKGCYQDCAVLYRTSAQSRIIEECLIRAGIPYRVHGGMRFYERAEIKDVLAYLRLAVFKDDNGSFERIINTPTRGIGQRTLEALRDLAKKMHGSLWQAARQIITDGDLGGRETKALNAFVELITRMSELDGLTLSKLIASVVDLSELREHYRKEKGERGETRLENIEELINAAGKFNMNEEEARENMTPLQAFLANAALESGETQASEHSDYAHLMTLHAAKGLEFPSVYLIGMEEDLFPHQRSRDDPEQLEEERRLCYVGITRAGQALTISHTQHRRLHGRDRYPRPSRFLKELPGTVIDEVRMGGTLPTATPRKRIVFDAPTPAKLVRYALGQRVTHAKFGDGVILKIEGAGPDLRLKITFANAGDKWLVAEYAKLETH